MSSIEIISKIETLKEYESIAAEAAAMIESIKDEIKRHMDTQGVDELTVNEYREYSNHHNGYSSVPASYVPPIRFKHSVKDRKRRYLVVKTKYH